MVNRLPSRCLAMILLTCMQYEFRDWELTLGDWTGGGGRVMSTADNNDDDDNRSDNTTNNRAISRHASQCGTQNALLGIFFIHQFQMSCPYDSGQQRKVRQGHFRGMTWQYNNQLNEDEEYVRRREDRILLLDNSTLYNNKLTRTQDITRIKDDEDTVMT